MNSHECVAVIAHQMHERGKVGEFWYQVSDIAKWLNVSKPTARKRLEDAIKIGAVTCAENGFYRGKVKWMYRLTDDAFLKASMNAPEWTNLMVHAKSYYHKRHVGVL